MPEDLRCTGSTQARSPSSGLGEGFIEIEGDSIRPKPADLTQSQTYLGSVAIEARSDLRIQVSVVWVMEEGSDQVTSVPNRNGY